MPSLVTQRFRCGLKLGKDSVLQHTKLQFGMFLDIWARLRENPAGSTKIATGPPSGAPELAEEN